MRRSGHWLCLGVALALAQGCVHATGPEVPPARAEGQRLEVAEHQAAEEAQKAAVARQKAEAQQVRAEVEAQKVAAQKARKEAAFAAAQAKQVAAEEAKQRALAEKQAAEQARLAESKRIQAEKEKARAAALAAKAAEQKAREKAALAAAKAKEAAAAELARQREKERQAAEAAKQKALAEKQAETAARRAEGERIKAEKEQARAEALDQRKAAKQAAEAQSGEARLPAEDLAVPAAPSDYLLRPGDEIDIQVYREPELSGAFKIDPSGDIRHSLAGAMPLAGKTISAAESYVTKRLAKDYLVNPRVIIKMVSTQSAQIVVLGEVKNPGVYPLPVGDSMTLLQAIAGAGGFTELASPERVRIVRKTPDGGQTTLRIRVSSLLAGKGRQQDVPLEPNDVIMVPDVVF